MHFDEEYLNFKYYLSKCIIFHSNEKYKLSSKKEIILLKIIYYKLSYILPKQYFVLIIKIFKNILKNKFSLDEFIEYKKPIIGLEFLSNSLVINYFLVQFKLRNIEFIKYSNNCKIHLDYFKIIPIYYYNRKYITELVLPNTLTIIPSYSFYNCVSLKKIIIPNSVIEIQSNAFKNCKKLKDIVFNQNLIIIECFAFCKCYKIKTLNFPASLSHLDEYAFNQCFNLRTVNFNSKLKSLDNKAFEDCYKLRTINTYNNLNLDLKNHRLKIINI